MVGEYGRITGGRYNQMTRSAGLKKWATWRNAGAMWGARAGGADLSIGRSEKEDHIKECRGNTGWLRLKGLATNYLGWFR